MTPLKPPYLQALTDKLTEQRMSPASELSIRLEKSRRCSMSEATPGTSEYDPSAYAKLIEEKERDLELVSKVGLDLLKQNQELKERNDFLQASLKETNEVITQLQHDLKNRNALLATFEDYENDNYAISESGERVGIVERLREKVNQLETENAHLRNEATKLRQKASDAEEFSHERIEDYLKQLEHANLRISRLQAQITDKNLECSQQSEEIKRLLDELSMARSREKSVDRTNEDLNRELSEAITKHEELKAEIIVLQELYVEVKSSLAEAEDELRGYRLNSRPHRSQSMDSLYDSLASELEVSDSGFYNTPMISARTDSRQSNINDFLNLREEIERLQRNEEPIVEAPSSEILAMTESQIQKEPQYVEVPSRVLLQTYRRSLSADRQRMPPKQLPMKPIPLALDTELATPMAENYSNAEPSTSVDARPSKAISKNHVVCTESLDQDIPQHTFQRNGKIYRNTSCSPIRIPSPPPKIESLVVLDRTPQSSPRSIRTDFLHSSNGTSYAPDSTHSSCCRSPASTSTEGTMSNSTSADSLTSYEGRKLGEPGKPGTRDLDISLRKLCIRQQPSNDKNFNLDPSHNTTKAAFEYEVYRRARGLPPSLGLFDLKTTNNVNLTESPLTKFLHKSELLRRQQLWRRMPTQLPKGSGLGAGMQISPLLKGILQRTSIVSTCKATPEHVPKVLNLPPSNDTTSSLDAELTISTPTTPSRLIGKARTRIEFSTPKMESSAPPLEDPLVGLSSITAGPGLYSTTTIVSNSPTIIRRGAL